MLNKINSAGKQAGFKINPTKTQIHTNGETGKVEIHGEELIWVEDAIYLGQLISFQHGTTKEINRRITTAWKKYWALRFVFKSNMNIALKRKAFNSCIIPSLTYGAQTWAMTKKHADRIRITQNAMERSMLGIRRIE